MPTVLGIAASTTATRVVLCDADDGRLFGEGQVEHPGAGTSLDHDLTTWWQALVEARRDAGGALAVAGVAAVARLAGLVALDAEARPVRRARIGIDPDASADARHLEEMLGREGWVAASGSVPSSAHPVAKLAWLRRREPDAYARVRWLLQPSDWLTLRLSREIVTDRGEASRTGYWSPVEDAWRPDLLALGDDSRDWEACLPAVVGPTEPAGDREGVVIAAGTGGPMAVALGLALAPGDVVIDADGSVFARRERPTTDPSGTVSGYADAAGRHLPLVETVDVGRVGATFSSVLGVDRARADQLAQTVAPGAGGLTFVPADAGRPGALFGIGADVTAAQIARALLEGTACALIDAIDALRSADVPVGGALFLVGSGARSHALRQVLADLTGRPVVVPRGDRAAIGACVQAAATLGARPPVEVAAAWGLRAGRVVEPDALIDAQEIRERWRACARRAEGG